MQALCNKSAHGYVARGKKAALLGVLATRSARLSLYRQQLDLIIHCMLSEDDRDMARDIQKMSEVVDV